jgi:hypothetical protein
MNFTQTAGPLNWSITTAINFNVKRFSWHNSLLTSQSDQIMFTSTGTNQQVDVTIIELNQQKLVQILDAKHSLR